MQANHVRTAQARAALKQYIKVAKRSPDTMKTDVIDLMTDLLHLCHAEDVEWGNIYYLAEQNFLAETNQREAAAHKHGRSIKNALPDPLYDVNGKQIREVTQKELDWTY